MGEFTFFLKLFTIKNEALAVSVWPEKRIGYNSRRFIERTESGEEGESLSSLEDSQDSSR
jgi:hypothetical protein